MCVLLDVHSPSYDQTGDWTQVFWLYTRCSTTELPDLRLLSWVVPYAMTDAPSHWGEGAALEQGPCHVTGYNANMYTECPMCHQLYFTTNLVVLSLPLPILKYLLRYIVTTSRDDQKQLNCSLGYSQSFLMERANVHDLSNK